MIFDTTDKTTLSAMSKSCKDTDQDDHAVLHDFTARSMN